MATTFPRVGGSTGRLTARRRRATCEASSVILAGLALLA
jgi:hypothetical protein